MIYEKTGVISALLFEKIPGKNLDEKIMWILFYVTCFQLAFLFPYIRIIPGQRANLFSGLLCASVLIMVFIKKRSELKLSSGEMIVSIILVCLALLSGIFSDAPQNAFIRAFVVAGSGLGGYWCSRLLLNNRVCLNFFKWFCLALLTGIIFLGLGSFFLKGVTTAFLGIHKHELNGIILILSFAPLALVYSKKKVQVISGVLMLIMSYAVISLSFDPMIWFPSILCLLVLFLKIKTIKLKSPWIFIVILMVVFASYFHTYHVPKRFGEKHDISTWIRIENYFFSFHMAKQHPFLGIGLTAPRYKYVPDYDIKYPYINKTTFGWTLLENRSSENQFLTFMCDVGFPFFFIYVMVTLRLFFILFKAVKKGDPIATFHPVVLFVPATGALLHLQFNDSLMQPQLCWFYHILLGMISNSLERNP